MRILTQIQAMDEMDGKSQSMIVTRAIIHTALWWPLWMGWVRLAPMGVAWSVIFKFLNEVNTFYMVIYWAVARSIAIGSPMSDRDQVKLALWVLFCFILMEFFTWAPLLF